MSASKKKKSNKNEVSENRNNSKKTAEKAEEKLNKNIDKSKEHLDPTSNKKNNSSKGIQKEESNVTSKKNKSEKLKTETTKKEPKSENANVEEVKKETKSETAKIEKVKKEIKSEKTKVDESKKQTNNEKIKEKTSEKKTKNEEAKAETTELVVTKPKDEKPEYVQEMLRKKKIKTIIFVLVVVLAILTFAFSTVFALSNLNSVKITKGISIKNVDVSNLSMEEAKEKLNSTLEKILIPDLNLKYNDEYNITLTAEQIDFKYNVDETLNEAYSIGRSGNIFLNNYNLLFTTLLGKNLKISYTYNEELLNNFIDDVNSKLPGIVVEPSYYIEENKLIVEPGKDGIEIVKEKLKKNILEAIELRTLEDVSQENYIQTIEIPTQNVKASSIDMDKVYSEIHTEPQDAYFELEPYKIYPDVDGIDLEISLDDAKKEISSERKEEYEFNLKITKAQKTIDDLGTEAFPYLISSFSTRYDASNTNRSTNLRIAAEKINGKVLMPGEIFSYNKTVGKRTVEEGYKDAKIYADGGVVDGLAGGICQISSTLYNAVLLANLEIVERRNHSYTTSYVAAGRDATVVWGAIDFQFKNTRNYPIKIEASVKNGVAEFKIHGMQEQEEYEISIIPQTTASIPYATTQIPDPTLAPGQQVVSQAGHLGYKVTTYIVKKLNGVEVSRELLSNDTYQPMKAIIRVGTPVEPTIQ